jgi:hypothetical protein
MLMNGKSNERQDNGPMVAISASASVYVHVEELEVLHSMCTAVDVQKRVGANTSRSMNCSWRTSADLQVSQARHGRGVHGGHGWGG